MGDVASWFAVGVERLQRERLGLAAAFLAAALAAIHSSLQSLAHTTIGETYALCEICLNRMKAPVAILTENRESN
jgi:hypothetical protein